MKIIGYSVSPFTGKKDNLSHQGLKIVLGVQKEDNTHRGIYYVKEAFFVDPKDDFLKLIGKYFNEGTDLDLFYNGYGSIKELRPIEKK